MVVQPTIFVFLRQVSQAAAAFLLHAHETSDSTEIGGAIEPRKKKLITFHWKLLVGLIGILISWFMK